jgi:hypothetical protein
MDCEDSRGEWYFFLGGLGLILLEVWQAIETDFLLAEIEVQEKQICPQQPDEHPLVNF